jgi:hypothetical protein
MFSVTEVFGASANELYPDANQSACNSSTQSWDFLQPAKEKLICNKRHVKAVEQCDCATATTAAKEEVETWKQERIVSLDSLWNSSSEVVSIVARVLACTGLVGSCVPCQELVRECQDWTSRIKTGCFSDKICPTTADCFTTHHAA